jgi:phosphomannomutase
LAALSARLSARGLTLFDRLYELYAEHGLWASAAHNLVLSGADALSRVTAALDALVAAPSLDLGEQYVERVIDYRIGSSERAPWLGPAELVELELASGARLFVRPSGTEPKLKLYGHVRSTITRRSVLATSLESTRKSAAALLQLLAAALQL